MTDLELKTAIETLDSEQKKEFPLRLRHMIDHIAKRIEYAESRRNFFLTSSGASFAAGVAIVGFALTKPVWLPVEFFLWALGVGLILFAITIWLIHASHVNFKYPFMAVVRAEKWFYRYAIPNWERYHFPWIRKLSKEKFNEDSKKFEEDYPIFLDRSNSNLLNPSETLLQDVKQIYLLHVNEMYKNRFLTNLRKAFERGILCVLVASAASFIIGAIIEEQSWPAKDNRQQLGLQIQSSWAPIYRGSATAGNLTMRIANRSQSNVTISGFYLCDKHGLLLPFDIVKSNPALPTTILAGSDVSIALTIDLKDNRLNNIHSVLLQR